MYPLSIHKELVLVLSLWQVQDRYEVIVALKERRKQLVKHGTFMSAKNPLLPHTETAVSGAHSAECLPLI